MERQEIGKKVMQGLLVLCFCWVGFVFLDPSFRFSDWSIEARAILSLAPFAIWALLGALLSLLRLL